jgi:hypothetical protein
VACCGDVGNDDVAAVVVVDDVEDDEDVLVCCWWLLPLPCCMDPDSGLAWPFFHGWNPLPTAASASGGGDMLLSLLHCAASIARGVPRRPG